MRKTKSVSSVIVKILQTLRPEQFVLSAGFVALVIASAINLLLPQIFRFLLTPAGQETFKQHTYLAITAVVLVFCAQAICFYYRSYFFGLASHRYVKRIRDRCFEKLIAQPLSYFANTKSGDLISRLSGDLAIVQDLVNFKISVLLRYALQVIAASILMLTISIKLTLALVLILPALVITSIIFGRKLKLLSNELQSQVGSAMSLAQDTLGDLRSTKIYKAENFLHNIFSKFTSDALLKGQERSRFSAFFQSFINLLLNIAIILLILYGFFLVSNAELLLADLLTFVMYAGIVAVSFALAASAYAEMSQASGAAERVFELLELSNSKIPFTASFQKIEANEAIKVRFDNVSFAYPNDLNFEILNNINFELLPEKPTALVGLSGAGKSSIANLLLGLYAPTKGNVLINDQNLKDYQLSSFYEKVAFVPQEPNLFNLSIAQNLRLAAPSASDQELWNVLEQVNLLEYVQQLEHGLNTNCGERGTNLSVGQRQRIALARAILRDPHLLVLDEANSALDSENEMQINSALEKFFRTRTTLIITHKYSSLTSISNILVLENKTIIQQGTHQELLNIPGLYKNLAKLQKV